MPLKKIKTEADYMQFLQQADPTLTDSVNTITSTYYIYHQPKLDELAYAARNVYNESTFIARQLIKKHQLVSRKPIEAELKRQTDYQQNNLFNSMGNQQNVQEIVKMVARNFKAFYQACKAYKKNPKRFSGKPKLPHYISKTTKRHTFRMSNQALKIKNGYLYHKKLNFKLKIDPAYLGYHLMSTLFVPIHNGFIVRVIFKITPRSYQKDNGSYVSIDPGVDNALVCVSNKDYQPFIINGRSIKSVNQYYHKRKANLQSIQAYSHQLETIIHTKKGLKPVYQQTRRMTHLDLIHNRKVDLFVYKAIKGVVNYALTCNAKIIFIGKNKNWKKKVKLGKANNQNFLGIPHARLIEKLTAKAALYGIRVIATNENYTSQTSFLDHEQPCWSNGTKARLKKNLHPANRRIERGLFKSNHKILINSDVNGALQIMKKGYQKLRKLSCKKHIYAFPKLTFGTGIEDVVLHPVKITPLI